MKKKWNYLLAVTALLLCLQGCGSKPAAEAPTAPPTETTAVPATTAAEPETQPAETEEVRDTAFYSGTWAVTGVQANGVDFTLEQAVAMGLGEAADFKLVLVSDGTLYAGTGIQTTAGIWIVTEDGIQAGQTPMSFDGTRLTMEVNGNLVYLEKQSDDQTVPEVPEETEPETTAEPETQAEEGLRPEFLEAMDAYEDFYREYCDLLKEYKKKPTNLSLLSKYAEMLGKVSEIDEKFKAWDSSDLNDAELKYYLEVSTRIQKMLIDVM